MMSEYNEETARAYATAMFICLGFVVVGFVGGVVAGYLIGAWLGC